MARAAEDNHRGGVDPIAGHGRAAIFPVGSRHSLNRSPVFNDVVSFSVSTKFGIDRNGIRVSLIGMLTSLIVGKQIPATGSRLAG
jgi:hypothetical protein